MNTNIWGSIEDIRTRLFVFSAAFCNFECMLHLQRFCFAKLYSFVSSRSATLWMTNFQTETCFSFLEIPPPRLSIEMNNFPSSLIMLQIELLKAQLTFNERLDGWTNEWLHGQFDFNGPCSKGWKAFCSYFWTVRCSWRWQARTTNWTMTEIETKKLSELIRSDGNTKAGIRLLIGRFLETASLVKLEGFMRF